jgi:hypothetical protein
VGRLVRSIALALAAAYLAAATTPCPQGARESAEAARFAGPAVHGSHDHPPAAAAHAADLRPSHGDVTLAGHDVQWVARCLCGCAERPAVGATPIGVGWAMVSRAPVSPLPAGAERLAVLVPDLPAAPSRAVDHVPLPA